MSGLTPSAAFEIASMTAFAGWVMLAALPGSAIVRALVRFGIVGVLAVGYVLLIVPHLTALSPQSFMSLAGIKALFGNDWLLVAGWVHYLAFDRVAGLWIAERAIAIKLGRLWLVLILVLTLMLGPVGVAVFYGVLARRRLSGQPRA